MEKGVRKHRVTAVVIARLSRTVKAFGLAYAYSYIPRLLTLTLLLLRNKVRVRSWLIQVGCTLTNGFVWDRFPAFCGSLVGGYHLLVLGLKAAIIAIVTRLHRHGHGGNVVRWQRITRPVAAFCSAWISLEVFNARRRSLHGDDRLPQSASSAIHHEKGVATTIEPYGRSIDLTLFTAARAMDCLAQVFQGECKPRNRRHQKRLLFAERRNSVMDPLIFASSAGVIMWAWFYQPLSLPKSYNKWIAQAARVDSRLVQVLRNARDGVFVYGQENDQSSILRGMCEEYEWPAEWADPSKTIPVPCQMVHMGAGPSCHWHAVVRFVETFKFAIKMYLPLQLLLKSSKLSMKAARKVMEESVRSSLFLSTFVALFYYGVCMSRTLVGPQLNRILGLSPMFWDSGACIAAGSVLCGWSVLVEDGKRRQEMAMFVLPRAFATLFPRQYTRKGFAIEKLVFSMSVASLFTVFQDHPKAIRGVFGRALNTVL